MEPSKSPSRIENKNINWFLNENEFYNIENQQTNDDLKPQGAPKSPTIKVEVDSDFQLLNEQSTADEIDIDSESLPLEVESSPKTNCRDDNDGLEDIPDEDEEMKKIRMQFKQGCDCEEVNCFDSLDPRGVYRHRLNITELTKAEHDMYLMGLTKACLTCNETTINNKERQRLRAHYIYQGRKVCLTAFLFLENCTRYQLKSIRRHIMTHGITPRVHGNHGKRPHNMFSLETYNQASEFLKKYFEQYNAGSGYARLPLVISTDLITRKHIHDLYIQSHMGENKSTDKLMGYCTFLSFIKHQFPHVKFVKQDVSSKTAKEIHKEKLSRHGNSAVESTSEVPTNCNQQKIRVVFPAKSDNQISSQSCNQILLTTASSETNVAKQVILSTNNSMISDQGQEFCLQRAPQQSSTFIVTPSYQISNQSLLLLTNLN